MRLAHVERGHARQQIGGQFGEALVEAGGAGVGPTGHLGQAGQQAGRVLERLALDQTGQEQVSLLPDGELVVEVDVGVAGGEDAGP